MTPTENKTFSTKPKSKNNKHDSITKVNFSDLVKSSYFSGERETIGFKGDKALYNRFKPIAKQLYGSVCRAFESFEAAVVYAVEQKVNLSYTSGNPINIEKIVIERNLRSRRKLEFVEETEVQEKAVVSGSVDSCAVCGRRSFARVIRKDGSMLFLCKKHFRVERPRLSSWRYVKDGVFS